MREVHYHFSVFSRIKLRLYNIHSYSFISEDHIGVVYSINIIAWTFLVGMYYIINLTNSWYLSLNSEDITHLNFCFVSYAIRVTLNIYVYSYELFVNSNCFLVYVLLYIYVWRNEALRTARVRFRDGVRLFYETSPLTRKFSIRNMFDSGHQRWLRLNFASYFSRCFVRFQNVRH